MNDQAKSVGTSDKMKAKDFITLGIFTVLFFAVVMVCIFASAATVVTFAFAAQSLHFPEALSICLCGQRYRKRGAFF